MSAKEKFINIIKNLKMYNISYILVPPRDYFKYRECGYKYPKGAESLRFFNGVDSYCIMVKEDKNKCLRMMIHMHM